MNRLALFAIFACLLQTSFCDVPESSVINVRKLLRFILENAEVPMQRAAPNRQSAPIIMNDLPTGYGQQPQPQPTIVRSQAPSYGSDSSSEFEPEQPSIQSAVPSWDQQQPQELPAVAQQSWGSQSQPQIKSVAPSWGQQSQEVPSLPEVAQQSWDSQPQPQQPQIKSAAPSWGQQQQPQELPAVAQQSWGSQPQQPQIKSAAPSWGQQQQPQELPAVAQQSWSSQPQPQLSSSTQQRIKVPSLQSILKVQTPLRQAAPSGYSVQSSSNDIQPLSYQSSYSAPSGYSPSYDQAPSYGPQQLGSLGLYGYHSQDLDGLCAPGLQFYPHPSSQFHFVHCSNYMAYVKACADGTVWNQGLLTCVHAY